MDGQKLKELLLSNRTQLYCVLDGASVPDLPVRLYEMRPPHYCLFRGELAPDMAYVAPYLVALLPDAPFTNWVLSECIGKHWGIFAHSRHSIKEMRRHFRALVTVYNEKGNPMIFRYYDPRVLQKFLPTCNGGELKTFFGKVETFFAESDDGKSFSAFQLESDRLKQTDLKGE